MKAQDTSLWKDFVSAYSPFPDRAMDALLPYLKRLVTVEEMRMVVSMKQIRNGPVTADEFSESMQISSEAAIEMLENGVLRGIMNKHTDKGKTVYALTQFPRRLFHFVAFEKGWKDFPKHIQRILSEWMHRVYYYDRYRPVAEKLKRGDPVENLPNQDIMLLDEVLEMVEAADDCALTSCNCRTLDQNCHFPTQTCIRFNHDAKTIVELHRGKRLTKEKMKQWVIDLDKKGLMHTGNREWRSVGLGHLCNCCACCCYPFRAGIELDLKGLWPRSHYIAQVEWNKCTQCGICIQRCQFGAYELDGTKVIVEGKLKENITFHPEKCWGCGLCANSCPPNAITMKAL